MERTLLLIKPDIVKIELIGAVIEMIEAVGLKIVEMRMLTITEDMAREHYKEHVDKPFYSELEGFMTSGPVVAIIAECWDAVSVARKVMGSTNPQDAAIRSIRGLFGSSLTENAIHGSDSVESAEREIEIFFGH